MSFKELILDLLEVELKESHDDLKLKVIERSRRLDILNKIILEAYNSSDTNSLYKNSMDFTLDLLNFDGGAIYLIDENTGRAMTPIFSKDRIIASLILASRNIHDFIRGKKI